MTCSHHWQLKAVWELEYGQQRWSPSVCKKCGEKKTFDNSPPDAWTFGRGTFGKPTEYR